MNLLSNASDAIKEEGEITIQTQKYENTVQIRISDTGIGISENIEQQIFDPFFTTKAVGKGTGLGLSISYSIIKKHKGTIKVESQDGVGSTFIIEIPTT